MTVDDVLAGLSACWRRAPTVDIDQLLRRVAIKRRRMQVVVGAELLGTMIAVSQLAWLLHQKLDPTFRLWAWCLIPIVIILQILFLTMRRGLWASRGNDVIHLLVLSRKRAQFGMKSAVINGLAFIAIALSLLPFAWNEFLEAQADPAKMPMFMLTIVANGTVVVVGILANSWYWNRQRERLRGISQILDSVCR